MNHGKSQKQALAVAYNTRKHMSKGGSVENEDLRPNHEPSNGSTTQRFPEQHLDHKAQDHEVIAEPTEPMTHERASEENMGREDQDILLVRRAIRMAQGGMVPSHEVRDDEMHKPSPGEDAALALNDTYPPGSAESNTQAQDEGFGNEPMHNEMSTDDQESKRSRMRAAIESARAGRRYPQPKMGN